MRFLLMVRWNDDGPPLAPAEEAALIREHIAYDQELVARGALIESGSLQLEQAATQVRVRGGKTSATDGPFAETKEHLGGFYVIQARDRDEAVRIAAGIPSARNGWIEVRPFRDLLQELGSSAPVKLDKPRIQELGPMRLTGLMGDYTRETMRDIPVLWSRFIPELQRTRVSHVGGRITYGAGFHCFEASPPTARPSTGSGRTEGSGFQYLCAVEVSDFQGVPAAWARIEIPARRYAVFPHHEHVSRLCEAIEAVVHQWLPGSGHAAALGGGAPDFLERYGEGFDPATGTGDLELWFPIR